ncbi:hypothetical protein ABEB22_15125 (plasmid) [Thioclava sp. 'Guangxiensis']|uniref:hypothetical protein n=1 Tax=Thioclava sp. 'Guangxiensis' TaxID=3149044 RepID=UPI0032C3F7FB
MDKTQARKAGKFFGDELLKFAVRWLIGALAVVAVWIFTPVKEGVLRFWTLPDRVNGWEAKLDSLTKAVASATGADRVIREPFGMAYIEEPVQQGQNVVLHLFVQRTELGEDCQLVQWVPLFRDVTNVDLPGMRASSAPIQQIGTDLSRVRIELVPPAALYPGRITVQLQLQYDCDGKLIPEKTKPVAYRLLKKG